MWIPTILIGSSAYLWPCYHWRSIPIACLMAPMKFTMYSCLALSNCVRLNCMTGMYLLVARIGEGSSADSYRRLLHHRNPFPHSISVVMGCGPLPVRSILILGLLREKAAPLRGRGQDCVVEPVT